MSRRNVVLAIAGVGLVSILAGVVLAADATAPWLRATDPTLQKAADLPSNVAPSNSNSDCTAITTQVIGLTGMQNDCVVQTATGQSGSGGIQFAGSNQEAPVVPPSPYLGLGGIPNQGMYFTYSSAPVSGLYMSFYRSILDKMKQLPDLVNDRLQYTLTSGPELMLKDSSGSPLRLNSSTVAFSPNGSWMVADVRYQGFIRVNLATFEITPFAPSLNAYTDANSSAQVTISNDGRYAVINPDQSPNIKVYDINSCNGAVMPVNPLNPKCLSRDYWPYLSSHIANFRGIYHPRFSYANQLSMAVMYDFVVAGNFKVARYNLTAPGENPLGIEYLGMGDSYASGQGAFDYTAGTDTANSTCHLSSLSYPYLLSKDLFSSGHSIACSGAVLGDINGNDASYQGQNKPKQLKSDLTNLGLLNSIISNYAPGYILQQDFVDTYNPQSITLSIGGNDIGFQDIVTKCVSSISQSTCYPTYEDQQELISRINGKIPSLTNTYNAISVPGRRVYVIGYPQIVIAGGNCAANVHLNDAEIKLFTNLTTTINNAIAQAAANAGVQYVDVGDAFVGHRMCETSSSNVAVNGLTTGNDTGFAGLKFIGNESYHPNVLGHQLLEQAILKKTNNLKATTVAASTISPTLPSKDAPKTGRSIRQTTGDTHLLPDSVTVASPTILTTHPYLVALRPASTYAVSLDAGATSLSTAIADTGGSVSVSFALPSTTVCGYHSVHVSGVNIIGQQIDISKTIFVNSATSDCLAPDSPCGVVPPSLVDSDKDGIDDACDPVINDPPPAPAYRVYLKGSSIHAVKNP